MHQSFRGASRGKNKWLRQYGKVIEHNGVSVFSFFIDANCLCSGINYLDVQPVNKERILSVTLNKNFPRQNFFCCEYQGEADREILYPEGSLARSAFVYNQSGAAPAAVFMSSAEPDVSTEGFSYYQFDPPLSLTGIQMKKGTSCWIKGSGQGEQGPLRFLENRGDTVVGIAGDDTFVLDINGIAANILGNYFWLPSFVLDLPSFGIIPLKAEIIAGRNPGVFYNQEILINADYPFITVESGDDPAYTSSSIYTVQGRVSSRDSYIHVNGQPAGLVNRQFTRQVKLEPGLNLIRIEAFSKLDGHSLGVKYLSVYRFQGELDIQLIYPSDGDVVSGEELEIQGRVFNSVEISSLEVNGNPARIAGHSFSHRINLSECPEEILVSVKDNIRGEKNRTFILNVDNKPPIISDVNPGDETWTASDYITVTGVAADLSEVEVYVNGGVASLSNSYFNKELFIQEGDNEINIVGFDNAGNQAVTPPFTIYKDTIPPENLIAQSSEKGWTNKVSHEICFQAEDNGSGISHYEVSEDQGAFFKAVSPYQSSRFSDGIHHVSVRCFDHVGNYSEVSVKLKIDTLPPMGPDVFRAIPGNKSGVLSWSDEPDDTTAYRICRKYNNVLIERIIKISEGQSCDENGQLFYEVPLEGGTDFIPEGIENTGEYNFELYAIDRAGNVSFPYTAVLKPGVAIEKYDPEEGVLVEYENVKLLIGEGSLPETIEKIVVTETESVEMEAKADFPLVSPIYSFSVVNEDNEIEKHTEFESDYLCRLGFSEEDLPDGFPEEMLGVFYYDTLWSKWFKIPGSLVDTEQNQIIFKTNHFTGLSIQPSIIEDLSAEERTALEFPPFSSKMKHSEIRISPQGGGLSTGMTEFCLEGHNGMDLKIQRVYDTGTAKLDASGFSGNLSLNLDMFSSESDNLEVLDEVISDSIISSLAEGVSSFLKNNGDYSLSLGQGWRLNFPYIRNGVEGVSVRLPSGAYYSINNMNLNKEKTKENGSIRELWFENHQGDDFEFCVVQALAPISECSLLEFALDSDSVGWTSSWYLLEAELIMKDGITYQFEAPGRIKEIRDLNDNTITFFYNGLLLDYILETRGRKVRFEYNDIFDALSLPQIKRIWIEGDPGNREVQYKYKNGLAEGALSILPVLTECTDLGGRKYHYDYDKKLLFSGNAGIKINVVSVIADLFTDGAFSAVASKFGMTSLSVHAGVSLKCVLPLSSAEGHGIGDNAIHYEVDRLSYANIDLGDFLLGFLPTAIDLTVGTEVRLLVDDYVFKDTITGKRRIEDWSFEYDYGLYKQFYCKSSIMDDGKSRMEYRYERLVTPRPTWACLGEQILNFFESGLFTRGRFSWEVTSRQKSVSLFDSLSQERIETTYYDWEDVHWRPAKVVRKRSADTWLSKRFQYDDWGNITEESVEEALRGYRVKIRCLNFYNGSNLQTVKNEDGLQPYPSDETRKGLPAGVHDRLVQQLVINDIPEINEKKGRIEYINRAWDYDLRGNLSREMVYSKQAGTWGITKYFYNSRGDTIRKISPEGNVSTFKYDDTTFPGYYLVSEKEVDLDLGEGLGFPVETAVVYDQFSDNPVWRCSGNGYITQYEYDAAGRVILLVLPDDNDPQEAAVFSLNINVFRDDNPITTIEYDDVNNSITLRGPQGSREDYFYNDAGQVVTSIKYNRYPEEETIRNEFEYDPYGQLIKFTDGAGMSTDYKRDLLGNIKKIIHPLIDGTRSEKNMEYDYTELTRIIIDENLGRTVEWLDFYDRIIKSQVYDERDSLLKEEFKYYCSMGNCIAKRDGLGAWFHYTYNEYGREILAEDPQSIYFNLGEKYIFSVSHETKYNLDGFIIEENENRRGDVISIQHGVNARGDRLFTEQTFTPISVHSGEIMEKLTAVTRFVYDRDGRLIKTIDPAGAISSTVWSAVGNRLSDTDPLGNTTLYSYDLAGRLSSLTDPRGGCGKYPNSDFTITYEYDDLDQLITGRLPANQFSSEKTTVRFDYDKRGLLIKRIEPDGEIISYEYDNRSRMIEETRSCITENEEFKTTFAYDGAGNLLKEVLPGGTENTYTYDNLKRISTEMRNGIIQRICSYDPNSNLLWENISGCGQTCYEYTLLNKLTKIIDPEGGITSYNYDEPGNLTQMISGIENITTTLYDERNLPLVETLPGGGKNYYGYNLRGWLEQKKDGAGNILTYKYGDSGLLDSITLDQDPDQFQVHYTYDEAGFLYKAETNRVCTLYNCPGGEYTPDSHGLIYRTDSIFDGKCNTTEYRYDLRGRPSLLRYPSGESCNYDYNPLGQLIGIPGLIEGKIKYNENGFLAGYSFCNGIEMHRNYDVNRRLSRLEYSNNEEILKSFAYQYDPADNIIAVNEDCFSYNRKKELIYSTTTGTGSSYEYPYVGDSKYLHADKDPLGQKSLDGFCQGENLTYQIDSGANSLGICLDYCCLVKKVIIYPSALNEERFNYDNIQLYTSCNNYPDSWEPIDKYKILVDPAAGSVTFEFVTAKYARYIKIHSHFYPMNPDGSAIASESEVSIAPESHLQVIITGGAENEIYSYDAVGNRKSRTLFSNTFYAVSYRYYPGTDLLMTDDNYAYRYDGNRNLVEKGDMFQGSGENLCIQKRGDYTRFSYDPLNRLIYVEKYEPESKKVVRIVEYVYNYQGYRIMKKTFEKTIRYTFDLEGKILEEETMIQGIEPEPPHVVDYYYLGSKYIARKESSSTYYYGTDHLGSPSILTNSDGSLVWRGAVSPFGDTQDTEGMHESVRFTGKELDEDTGLYYFNARWYDPDLGRFTTEDPARDGINWFVYVGNNPLGFVDPSGLAPQNLPEEQRTTYMNFISNATTDGLQSGYVCSTFAVWLSSSATQAATGNQEFFKNFQRDGNNLISIHGLQAKDFYDNDAANNISYYKKPDGTTDTAFNSPNIEIGSVGVFGTNTPLDDNNRGGWTGHIWTVTDVTRVDGEVTEFDVIQGHTTDTADKVTIKAQDFQEYINGTGSFLGWGEVGQGSATVSTQGTTSEFIDTDEMIEKY